MQWLNGICGSIYDAQVKEDVPAGLRSHVFVFRVMCFWPIAEDPRWYKWLTTSLYLSIGVLFPLSLCVNIFFVTSVQEAMDHIFLSVAFSTTGFKMGIIYWQLDNIRELFRIHAELLRGAWRNAVNHSRTARLNLRIHMLFTLMYGSTAVGFLLQVAYSRPEDSVYTSTLLYPFDFMHSRAIYSTVLVYQCVGNMCSGIWAALTFTFLSALMNIACGHLADLKDRLRNLGTANDTSMFYKDLIDCCKCYGMCLRFTDIMTNILSPSYFAQFVVSGGVLCCTVYLLSVMDPMDDFLKFSFVVTYFNCVIFQVLLNCYFGSRLSAESDGITQAIYTAQWMDRDEKFKRALGILGERSMRPITIYPGGIFELSLPTFVKICRVAYSYFNVLRTMDAKLA